MCSNYPEIKLEPTLGTLENKIEHLSSYAHVVHTTAKQVISRRGKNENVYKMSKNEKCTCKECKNTVFHCQLCKFVGFLLPSSSWLLKLPINFGEQTLTGAFFFLKSWQLLSRYCDHRNDHFANGCCEYPDYKITKA